MDAPVLLARDEPRFLENAQVPGHGRQRDRERAGELADGGLGREGELREDRPARRVGQGSERRVEGG